ncbi:MAG: preprotein translocase subunit YajC [Candidatus Omnitrophota bacterium]|jgi:preprotein translocase subunit YajC|nr:preprotein translocase subunit YajC [Candidatus Omnitrophota bacterium]
MPPEQAANPLIQLVPYILVFFIFYYFLLIKPQRDQQKQHDNMLNALKKNDEVVTASGIHGTVVLIKDKTIVIRVDDNVKIEFDKSAVTGVTKTNA